MHSLPFPCTRQPLQSPPWPELKSQQDLVVIWAWEMTETREAQACLCIWSSLLLVSMNKPDVRETREKWAQNVWHRGNWVSLPEDPLLSGEGMQKSSFSDHLAKDCSVNMVRQWGQTGQIIIKQLGNKKRSYSDLTTVLKTGALSQANEAQAAYFPSVHAGIGTEPPCLATISDSLFTVCSFPQVACTNCTLSYVSHHAMSATLNRTDLVWAPYLEPSPA